MTIQTPEEIASDQVVSLYCRDKVRERITAKLACPVIFTHNEHLAAGRHVRGIGRHLGIVQRVVVLGADVHVGKRVLWAVWRCDTTHEQVDISMHFLAQKEV